ncbi:hypothetical protein K438DRAFT_1782362 [Mycena galopus ATCC 62051]|nr:hypothetical protein K438DRAFT_1782362 [Mycena galopus ATCC 62051]
MPLPKCQNSTPTIPPTVSRDIGDIGYSTVAQVNGNPKAEDGQYLEYAAVYGVAMGAGTADQYTFLAEEVESPTPASSVKEINPDLPGLTSLVEPKRSTFVEHFTYTLSLTPKCEGDVGEEGEDDHDPDPLTPGNEPVSLLEQANDD